MSKIRSREDETYSAVTALSSYGHVNADTFLYGEIAISLGRIADMLTEVNGYKVEYDSENEGRMADYYQDEESEDEEWQMLNNEAIDMAIEALDKQQGEWVDEDSDRVEIDDNGITEGSCWCSVCGEWLVASDEFPTKGNYCPNCGAYMNR